MLPWNLKPCAFALAIGSLAQTITVDTSHPVNTFVPQRALGAGVDRLPTGSTDKLLSEPVLSQVLEAGWQTVTYRQNTELHVEAWHWNLKGTWSDPSGKGYFTGDATPGEPIRHSFGYPLPHRGFTRNDGTEGSGFSRLDDGDLKSYWKSNPYLAQAFTDEDDALHPQWLIFDFGNKQEVNTIRIEWGEPYARAYFVQFWNGGDDPIKQATKGSWQTFPTGAVLDGKGGSATLKLTITPMPVRFLRIWMTASSNTCDDHGPSDKRNCVGYAVREISAGTVSTDGEFHDAVSHAPSQEQTVTYCSSVDPWHKPSDLDEKAGDQAGLDFFYTSGVTRGLPAMIPVAMLYGTPEDASAEIRYLEASRYPVSYVEMGEEPDGQFMLPEDYGALYLQWANALHKVNPSLKLGGPVFEGVNEDILVWPDAQGRSSWLGRFINYLKSHGRLNDLAFFSFEHYPFEPCKTTWNSLYEEPKLMAHIMDIWREDGLPANVPIFDTETNLSWNLNQSFVDIFGGLWVADSIGSFLTAGGSGTYYFHYLPLPLGRGCADSWATFSMQTADRDYSVKSRTAQFFASQMISQVWVQPGDQAHKVFRATSGDSLISAYALQRPNGEWSLMIVNKDQDNARIVPVAFENQGRKGSFSGAVRMTTFGVAQYQWHPDGPNGYAYPDGPAVTSTIQAGPETQFTLPQASITVLAGQAPRARGTTP